MAVNLFEQHRPREATITVSQGDPTQNQDYSGDFVCDGVADDVELNAAITYIGALGSGEIMVLQGTYDMTAAHTVIDNLSIVGLGKNKTIFNVTANINLFACTVGANPSFVTFVDFSVILTNAPGDQVGVVRAFYLLSGTDLNFTNILVEDGWTTVAPVPVGTSASFWIGNYASEFGIVERVWMLNCEADGRGVRDFGGLGVFGWLTGFVCNCRFKVRDSDVAIDAGLPASVGIHRAKTVHFSNCIIEYGHHNGVWFADNSAAGFYSEDIAFVVCTFRNNGDDAIDPNYDFDISIIGCNFVDNEFELVSFEDGCERCRVIGCKTDDRRVIVSASSRIVISGNHFIRAERGACGVQVLSSSSIVTITGNEFRNCSNAIRIDTSTLVTITGNIMDAVNYQDSCLIIDDSTYVSVIGNIILGPTSTAIHAIEEQGTSDYNVISWNIFWTADGNDFYTVFVGANTIVENNTGDRMRDADGSMTGAAGTFYTYDRQSGQITGISTAAVARVAGAETYHTRFPLGITPRLTATLVDVNAAVTIDTVQVDTVTNIGFNWSINVTTLFADSECKLDWKARPTHRMYD